VTALRSSPKHQWYLSGIFGTFLLNVFLWVIYLVFVYLIEHWNQSCHIPMHACQAFFLVEKVSALRSTIETCAYPLQ
jgi:hypothetical protein